jgi:hypothetical protein
LFCDGMTPEDQPDFVNRVGAHRCAKPERLHGP